MTAMNTLALQAENLTKVYRLYRKPLHRMLDLFGLLPRRLNLYSEHVAVSGISLEIRRGEKVAIIGRNGAGKSTLLKMISGVVTPSAGSMQINGRVHALLNLGTGFHPDFTGRDNVYSYLAHIGITGERADKLFREIADFAELHEYIDQPTKTYSAGMNMRLAFATSTVIDPDILVIDEVLSVGDAYFFRKSFERVKELCSAHGATLIMVTHDFYSAMTFCDRCIWIDHGTIRADGPIKQVVAAYEASIRDQEEIRLRQKHLNSLQDNRRIATTDIALFGEIITANGLPPSAPVAISHIKFLENGNEIATLLPDHVSPDTPNRLLVSEQEGNWGGIEEYHGRLARRFLPHGSIFHKLPFMIAQREVIEAALGKRLSVAIGTHSSETTDLELRLRRPSGERLLGFSWTNQASEWGEMVPVSLENPNALTMLPGSPAARHGQRAMEIIDISFRNEAGAESLQFDTGKPMTILLRYRLNREGFDECPTLIVAFQKDGVLRTHRFFTETLRLRATESTNGEVRIDTPQLLVGPGSYLITVSVFAEGYFRSSGPKKFFSANDQLYDMHTRSYELMVRPDPDNPLLNDVVFHHPTQWQNFPHAVSADGAQ
jgi:lipopolysaccharide transport system ATP-binding protein